MPRITPVTLLTEVSHQSHYWLKYHTSHITDWSITPVTLLTEVSHQSHYWLKYHTSHTIDWSITPVTLLTEVSHQSHYWLKYHTSHIIDWSTQNSNQISQTSCSHCSTFNMFWSSVCSDTTPKSFISWWQVSGCAIFTHLIVMTIPWVNNYSTTRWLPCARSCCNSYASSCGQPFPPPFIIKAFSPFCKLYRPIYRIQVQVDAFRNLKSFYIKIHFNITPHCALSSTKRSVPVGIFKRILVFDFHLPYLYFMSNQSYLPRILSAWWHLMDFTDYEVSGITWTLKAKTKLQTEIDGRRQSYFNGHSEYYLEQRSKI